MAYRGRDLGKIRLIRIIGVMRQRGRFARLKLCAGFATLVNHHADFLVPQTGTHDW